MLEWFTFMDEMLHFYPAAEADRENSDWNEAHLSVT